MVNSVGVASNQALVLNGNLANQGAVQNSAWTYQVPADTFSDADNGMLAFGATLVGGSALPTLLTFDATPPANFAGTLDIRVSVPDSSILTIYQFFLVVSNTFQNVIEGTANGEALNGTAGTDTIIGLGGNDALRCLDGNDAIEGKARDDVINVVGENLCLERQDRHQNIHFGDYCYHICNELMVNAFPVNPVSSYVMQ